MFKKQSLLKILLVVLALSFFAKIFAGYHLRETFLERGNSKTFLNLIAYNLLLHDEFSVATGTPSVDYEPLYPYLMNVAYSLTGNDWIGLTILQALLHFFTSLMLFFIGKRLWNELAGFVAAIYHAFYPYLFTYSLSVYDTTVFVFLLVALVYVTLKENHKVIQLVLAGCLIACGFLTRGTILTFIPPVLLFVFYQSFIKGGFVKATINCAVVILSTVAVMSPWLLRNHEYTGKYFVSTHGPFGLWQGNNEFTRHYLTKDISLDEVYRQKPLPEIYKKYPMKQRQPNKAVEVSAAYKEEAVEWIKNNPEEFLSLSLIKAQKLWTWNRNPKSLNPKVGSNEDRQVVNLVSYLPLLFSLPFGLAFLYKRNKPNALFIAGILICFTGAHMIAMGFTRARIPIDFLLMLCAGICVSVLVSRFFKAQSF